MYSEIRLVQNTSCTTVCIVHSFLRITSVYIEHAQEGGIIHVHLLVKIPRGWQSRFRGDRYVSSEPHLNSEPMSPKHSIFFGYKLARFEVTN